MTRSRVLMIVLIAAAVCVASAGVGAADEVNVTLEGHFGGTTDAVAVSGNYVYIGQGQDFVVLDVSSQDSPVELGRVTTPDIVLDVVVSGDYAYVVGGYYGGGLVIVDVSSKSAPTLAGSYAGSARGVAVSGDYAYVADQHNGLVIVDVRDKAAPTLVGSYDTAGNAWDVSVSGNYAYVADDYSLVIVDISSKSSPTLVGSYDTEGGVVEGGAYGVAVSGDYAYVTVVDIGLVIVDVTDKTAPTLTGSYDTEVGIGSGAQGVAVLGDYAHVAEGWYNGLVIVDVSSKSSPTLAGSYDTEGNARGVAVSGDYAYVADQHNGLVIVDVRDKAAPTLVGSYDTAGGAEDVTVSGDYAYVADWHSGLMIVDVRSKSAPMLAGSYNTAGFAYGVAVSGDYAYVADGWDGLVIVDISSKSSPTLAGSYDTGSARGVAVSGDYAYVADQHNGLVIVDVRDKAAPTLVGSYDTAGNAWDVSVSGNYAYVADDYSLVIVDISSKSSPTLVGSYDTAGNAYGVAVSGDYAYVADGGNGLVIVDITDKAAPVLAGGYDTGWAYGVAVSGDYAYVANCDTGLVIVDVTDKSAPTLAGSYNTAGRAEGIAVSGDYAYVADRKNGLVILRTDPIPKSLSVELYFDKEYFDTESRTIETKSHATELEAGDKLKGYAKTTLTSGDYTVKTYIKMIMPDGTEKYAYSTSSPFCPECPLNFSDTKVSFRPDTWEAETKLWNWDIYKMTGTEPEGDYTWEFWYEDATTGEVLASSAATYTFSRTTELLQKGRHKYFVRISNIDDDGIVWVNGDGVASATFNGDSGWVEISDKLLYDGENDIRFNVTNHPERYPENWTYKFELSTFTDESKIIWKDSCGSVGSKSCNNNQNTGEVYNKTVKLTITPLFTRETVEYTSLDDKTFDLYSIDYNDNPPRSDYMIVVSPLLAQAFVVEEETGNQEEIQKRIDNKTNQIEEALTAVLEKHEDMNPYILFVDNEMRYESNIEKLRADVYGLPFVYYRGPGIKLGNLLDKDHGDIKTYKEIKNAQIKPTNDIWIGYGNSINEKSKTIRTGNNFYILILGSAGEFPEFKSNGKIGSLDNVNFFSDLFYVNENIISGNNKITQENINGKIGRLPIEYTSDYFNTDKVFHKKALVHSMYSSKICRIVPVMGFRDNYFNPILKSLTGQDLGKIKEPDNPLEGFKEGFGERGKKYNVSYFIAKESHAGNHEINLKDYSVLATGWHGNTNGIYSKPKKDINKKEYKLINVHPIVYTGTSCLSSNVGYYDKNGIGKSEELFSHILLTNGSTIAGNTLYGVRDSRLMSHWFVNWLQYSKDVGTAWEGVMKAYSGKSDYLYARNQFRLLGDPKLNTTALDDPLDSTISSLPQCFNIGINASYTETSINDHFLLDMNLSSNSSLNGTYVISKDQFATGTGAPMAPIIYIDIPMPVNQTIDNVTVVYDDSYTTSINLAEHVSILLTPDGAEVIPGIEIHGDYPPVNFTYSLVTVPDERLLKIQAIPVKYDINSQIAELYRSINVTVHTKPFVEENITAKVHIDPSSDYLALHQDENASLIISLYNDYSATENATDVSVTAEIPDNLEIVSANGTINGTIEGHTVTWDVNNLTTSGINSFKSVELLIQAPASIPDTTIEQINLTATYSNESGGVYEPIEVPIQISLIPPDYVDLTVSNMVIHRPLKLGTPTNVTAVISNDGDINVTYVSVRLLIDGNESSGLIMDTPAKENQSVNLSIGGLAPGKHQIAIIVQPIGIETNITNNIATEDVDIYFAMFPPLSTTDPYNLPYGSTLPIKFTVRDNETSEFISDYTVNVSILNSTNHIITSFNATSGVLIDSDEEQYAVDFNTTNYPELMSGETYAVSVTFGGDDGLLSYGTAYFTLEDRTPPRSITDLHPTRGTTWINWTWTNPPDLDFNHTMVYLNGTWQANTSNPFYNATGLSPDASYEIGTHTVDTSGNVNTTWVNQTTNITQKGDLNHDGILTSADVLIALEIAVSGEYVPEADIDENGCVNALDARMIMQAAAGRIEL